MAFKAGLNVSTTKLEEFKHQCLQMAGLVNTVIQKRQTLIDFKGYTNQEEQRLNSLINPEDYYSFRMFEVGCEIVYTNNFFDEKTQMWYKNNKKYIYAIKYYNCKSKIWEKDKSIKYCWDNSSYGQFESLDVAISYFRKAVVDILVQFGRCNALNPLDFM